MALTKEQKVERVAQYTELLEQSRGIILVDYRGLSVADMQRIRGTMRPISGQLQVIKNRLMALALEEVDISLPDEWLTGPTAIGYCSDEVPPIAKALMDARDETGMLDIKGGWMSGSVISAQQVKSIAALPSREVLLAQVLGAINGPSRQVAGVVASGVRRILNVLQAYVDKMEEEDAAPDAGMEPAVEPA